MSRWVKADMFQGPVDGIELPGVLAILKTGDEIDFVEMCDEFHQIRFTKQEAVSVLKEAIAYIEGQS